MITTIFQKQDPGTKSKTNRNVDKGTSELKSAKTVNRYNADITGFSMK